MLPRTFKTLFPIATFLPNDKSRQWTSLWMSSWGCPNASLILNPVRCYNSNFTNQKSGSHLRFLLVFPHPRSLPALLILPLKCPLNLYISIFVATTLVLTCLDSCFLLSIIKLASDFSALIITYSLYFHCCEFILYLVPRIILEKCLFSSYHFHT